MSVILSGYINHAGSTRDGAGNTFWAVTQDAPGEDNTDLVILKRSDSGVWSEVKRFTEAEYGKHGYGSLEVVGPHLVCGLSERDASGVTNFVEHIIPNVAVAWGDWLRTMLAALR